MDGELDLQASAKDAPRGKGASWRPVILLGTLAALAGAAFFLPVGLWFDTFLDWTGSLGFWGPLVLGVAYVAACVLLVPGTILTLGAGAIFGVVLGTITVSLASTLGATAAFLVGRFIARDWVAAKVSANARFAAIDRAVGKQGFRIVLLTRLSPVFPFAWLNYGYGLTDVPLWKYFLASWIGMFPATVMFVYVGSLLGVAAGGARDKTDAEWVLYGVGLAATIAVAAVVTRVARKALAGAVADREAPAAGPADQDEGAA